MAAVVRAAVDRLDCHDAGCTMLDQTVNQTSERFSKGLRAPTSKNTPSVAYTPTII
jgi:hypothetical protein